MEKRSIIFFALIPVLLVLLTGVSDSAKKDLKTSQAKITADAGEWSEPVYISKSPQDSAFPKVTASEEGIAYAMWSQESGGKAVFFATNEDDEWSVPENITRSMVRVREGPWPELTLDAEGNVFVIYTAVTDGNYEVVYTRRKGKVWGPHENVSRTQEAGSTSATPMVDPRTNDYFVHWQDDIDRPTPEAFYWRTYVRYKEGGEGSWIGAGGIGDESGRDYGPEAAMDINGALYAVWGNRRGGFSNVFFVESKTPKINSSYSAPLDLSGSSGIDFAEPQIAVDNAGNVYVVWQQMNQGNLEVFFRKRIDGEWMEIENVSQTEGRSELPTIGVDRVAGKVYVAWSDTTSGKWAIYLREFDGEKWKDIENLTQSSPKSARPDLYCDSGGGVHLVYLQEVGNWRVFYQKKEGVYDIPCYPPLNVTMKTGIESGSSPSTKKNTVMWDENPENSKHKELYYVIYRKEIGQDDSQYETIATVSGDIFTYSDTGLPTTNKYWYRLKSLNKWGSESEEPSNAVTEQWMWPVNEISLQTQYNRFLFFQEKINTLSWSPRALNDAVVIDKYDIYRKKSSEDNSTYQLVSSVQADVFTYRERELPLNEKFTYRIFVVDIDGNQSPPSRAVIEE
ncbi:MAG: hypothetical protein JXB23_08305 [Candidatus Aminicenantes bacterium]|nr:hypothetical protein [Candidatus Aminicenantes bacterium]